MGHVGNCHPQTESSRLGLAVNGIVKIPGILAVNGHKGQVAQIKPRALVRGTGLVPQGSGLSQCRLGPLPGNLMGTYGDIDFQTRIQVITQNFLDSALGAQNLRWIVGDTNRYHLPGHGALFLIGRDENMLRDAGVVGHQEPDAALLHIPPRKRGNSPLQHLDNLALPPAPGICGHLGDQGAIAIENLLHLAAAEIKIIATLQRGSKTVTIPMADNAAGLQLKTFTQPNLTAATQVQLSVPTHRLDALAQGFQLLISGELQSRRQCRQAEQFPRVLKQLQYGLATGDGVLVPAGLPGGIGILRFPRLFGRRL